MDLVNPDATPAERGRAAALTAMATAELVGDVNAFLAGSLDLSAGSLTLEGRISTMGFNAPAGCVAHGSFDRGGVMLDHDCTLPSGRHTSGSLTLRFGAACTPFGLSIEHHLLVESAPGRGDQVRVDGHTDLGLGDGHLNLATTLETHVADDGHTFDDSVAGCFILDGPKEMLAMNGQVLTVVDGTTVARVEIDDLQLAFCEGIPHTGTVRVADERHSVEVVFDHASPDTAKVSVTVDGTTREEVSVSPIGRACARRGAPPLPLMIDYASCGGCGQPPPPAMPSTTKPNPGSGGGSGGSTGPDPNGL